MEWRKGGVEVEWRYGEWSWSIGGIEWMWSVDGEECWWSGGWEEWRCVQADSWVATAVDGPVEDGPTYRCSL